MRKADKEWWNETRDEIVAKKDPSILIIDDLHYFDFEQEIYLNANNKSVVYRNFRLSSCNSLEAVEAYRVKSWLWGPKILEDMYISFIEHNMSPAVIKLARKKFFKYQRFQKKEHERQENDVSGLKIVEYK